MKKRALFSLSDTTNVDYFASKLIELGWEIIATKETVEILKEKNIPCIPIEDFVGIKEEYPFPPTLHAKIEHALTSEDAKEKIDLVYVIPYKKEKGNDVGGRTLLSLAIKGNRIPVMTIDDMMLIIHMLDKNNFDDYTKEYLKDKCNFEISNHFSSYIKHKEAYFTEHFLSYKYLINGENPYQTPCIMMQNHNIFDPYSLFNFEQISGELPCFTNIADSDCILETMNLMQQAFNLNLGYIPEICICAKHGNPCGVGVANNEEEAIDKALFGNPLAIWGGEVLINFDIDKELAQLLFKSKKRKELYDNENWMLDVILAPNFDEDAIEILGKRKERKLLQNRFINFIDSYMWDLDKNSYRFIKNGILKQPKADYILDIKNCETTKQFSDQEKIDLIISWATVFSSNVGGNEVALSKDGELLTLGGGASTVDAVDVAIFKAERYKKKLIDSTFASDAFFPFIDAPGLLTSRLVRNGCTISGGKNFKRVKDYFKSNNIEMIYIPEQFRGFCRH